MSSLAKQFGQIMKVLVNDDKLKELMVIPEQDRQNYSKLLEEYFIETYLSDILTTDSICRLLIYPADTRETLNKFVYADSFIIEIFVPSKLDRLGMENFERRILKIADRLIQLFHNKTINGTSFRLTGKNELMSGSREFKRYFLKFSFKKVYC